MSSVSFRARCKASIRHERKHKKNKNFVVRALKTKQVGNVFSLCDCQENPTLIKYFKWRKIKRPLKLYI